MPRRVASIGLGIFAVATAGFVYWVAKPDAPKPIAIAPKPVENVPTPLAMPVADSAEGSEKEAPTVHLAEDGTFTAPSMVDPETKEPLVPPIKLEQGELPWEGTIRSVLTNDKLSEEKKGQALLGILAGVPAEGAQTCAEEAIKRIPSSDYQRAQVIVSNPSTYGLAMAVLYSDLMERPDQWRLPTLLMIARNQSHPMAGSARDNLDFLLGKNFGEDWGAWDQAIRAKLNGTPK